MAYKVFTNGSPLPASDLNTYLMNQSVITFANSTARSSTLTSPTEGMVTYLEDTNKVEVYTGAAWVDINDNSGAIPLSTVTATGDLIVGTGSATVGRLGIGTNGQVLSSNGTTATWVSPTSGGKTLLSTTSLTGSQVDLTSIPGTYTALELVIRNFRPGTDATSIRLRFNNDSTSNRYASVSDTGSGPLANAFGSTSISLTGTNDDTVDSGLTWAFIPDYANTTTWKFTRYSSATVDATTTTSYRLNQNVAIYNQTNAITQINLVGPAGGFTSGTALLYGVN